MGEPAGAGVDVHAGVEDVGPLPEDLLRAVALMGVDVDNRNPLITGGAQPLGGGGSAVEIAGTAEERRAGVVTGWPHGGIGGSRSTGDEVGGMGGGVHRAARRVERSLAEQRHRVHGVEPEFGANRRRPPPGEMAAGERPGGEEVRNDVRLARVDEMSFGDP